MALTDKLTNIADAIRTKTETTDKMTLDEMPEKISRLDDISKYFNTNLSGIGAIHALQSIEQLPKLTLTETSDDDIGKSRITSNCFNNMEALKKIPEIELKGITVDKLSANNLFSNCKKLTDVSNIIPILAKYKIYDIQAMFSNCTIIPQEQFQNVLDHIQLVFDKTLSGSNQLPATVFLTNNSTVEEINISFDTSKITDFSRMFVYCSALKKVSAIDASGAGNVSSAFENCNKLTDFGGFTNLGKTQPTFSTQSYLNLPSLLNHQSIINILNGLYDITETSWSNCILHIGSQYYDSLSSEEKKIATDKGWLLSA